MYKFELNNPIANQVEHLRKMIALLEEEKKWLYIAIGGITSEQAIFSGPHEDFIKRELEVVKNKQRICDIDLEIISKQSMLSILEEKMAIDSKELLSEFEDALPHFEKIKQKAIDYLGSNQNVSFKNRVRYLLNECEYTISLSKEEQYKGAFMFFFTTLCCELTNATGKPVL